MLLNIIDHLPAWSWTNSAIASDDEHARMLLAEVKRRAAGSGGGPPPGTPPLHTWTPEVAALTALTDAVRQLQAVTANAFGGKAQPPKPLPRPETALQRAERRWAMEQHEALVARVLPKKRDEAVDSAQPD